MRSKFLQTVLLGTLAFITAGLFTTAQAQSVSFTKTLAEGTGSGLDSEINSRTHDFTFTITNNTGSTLVFDLLDSLSGFGGGSWTGVKSCEGYSSLDAVEAKACEGRTETKSGETIRIDQLKVSAGGRVTLVLTGTESGTKTTDRCNQAELLYAVEDPRADYTKLTDEQKTRILSDNPETVAADDATCGKVDGGGETRAPTCSITDNVSGVVEVGSTVIFSIILTGTDASLYSNLNILGLLAAGGSFDTGVYPPNTLACSLASAGTGSSCGSFAADTGLGQYKLDSGAIAGVGATLTLEVPVQIAADYAPDTYTLDPTLYFGSKETAICGSHDVKVREKTETKADLSITKESYANDKYVLSNSTQTHYTPGQPMLYVLDVSNAGPNDVTAGTWGDVLPQGFTYNSFAANCTCATAGCAAAVTSYSPSSGLVGTFSLPANCSIALHIYGQY